MNHLDLVAALEAGKGFFKAALAYVAPGAHEVGPDVDTHVQYASSNRAARSTSSSDGRKNSSSGGEYGTGVSRAPRIRTGASSDSNASSWITAAILSPIPPVRESS